MKENLITKESELQRLCIAGVVDKEFIQALNQEEDATIVTKKIDKYLKCYKRLNGLKQHCKQIGLKFDFSPYENVSELGKEILENLSLKIEFEKEERKRKNKLKNRQNSPAKNRKQQAKDKSKSIDQISTGESLRTTSGGLPGLGKR